MGGFVALALTNWITLEIPLLAKWIINGLSEGQKSSDLTILALCIVGLGLLTMLTRTLSRLLIFWPGRQLESEVKDDVFADLLGLKQLFYQKFGMGEIISRISNDVGQLRAFFAFGILQLANLVFLLGFTVFKMLEIHPKLALVALSPLFAMIFFMKFMMNVMHRVSKETQEAIGYLTNRVTEAFINVHVIKANSAETAFFDKAQIENHRVYRSHLKSVFVRTAVFPLLAALMNLSQVAVLFYGGFEVLAGRLTIGDIMAFNVYIAYLGFPLSAFGMIVSLYQYALAALARLETIEKAEKEGTQNGNHPQLKQTEEFLCIKDLSFTYPDACEPALSGVNLSLKQGERLGIFGSIGSGKSTLFQLITGLLLPQRGQILYGQADLLDWDIQQLRKEIVFAEQGVHLFSSTVQENLRLGKPDATNDELESAARSAQIFDEIAAFDQGWNTQIGEKGVRLSGGQKQRLALARIFLRSPKIFLFDDVLSAVDHHTEENLISEIHSRKTAMLIASHRHLCCGNVTESLFLKRVA